MLTDVRVYRTPADYLVFPLFEVGPYSLKSIDGLGAVRTEITENYMTNVDQYAHNRFNTDYRSVIINVGIEADYTTGESVQELRKKLHTYFPKYKAVTLRFTDDALGVVEASGHIESVTPEIFTSDPGATIVVACPDPYFRAINEVLIANPVQGANSTYTINYGGSAPVGYRFKIEPNGGPIATINFDGFRISNSIQVGQRVEVSTVPGDKYVRFYESAGASTYKNWTKYVNHLTDWGKLLLQPGTNVKTMSWSGGSANPFKNLRWTPKYLSL